MTSIRTEGEVEERVDHDGSVDGPFHDGNVRLSEWQKFWQGQQCSKFPFGQNILNIEQFEWGSRGFEEQDEEQGDEGQPEVGGSEATGAASSRLDEESEPGDDEEDHGENEGEEEGGEVEVEAGGGAPVNAGVHAHGRVLGPPGDDVPVGVLGPGPDLREEGGGDSEEGREEPDERDVDGVRPGSGDILALGPLGVLHKQMVGQEQDCQWQEEQEAVVEIPKIEKLYLIKLTKFNYQLQLPLFKADLPVLFEISSFFNGIKLQFC